MSVAQKIECQQHGEQDTALVCQHIVEGLRQGRSVGFFWSSADDSPHPDAWCSECQERVSKTGGEWIGEAEEKLGAKFLCGKCYELAKAYTVEIHPPPTSHSMLKKILLSLGALAVAAALIYDHQTSGSHAISSTPLDRRRIEALHFVHARLTGKIPPGNDPVEFEMPRPIFDALAALGKTPGYWLATEKSPEPGSILEVATMRDPTSKRYLGSSLAIRPDGSARIRLPENDWQELIQNARAIHVTRSSVP